MKRWQKQHIKQQGVRSGFLSFNQIEVPFESDSNFIDTTRIYSLMNEIRQLKRRFGLPE